MFLGRGEMGSKPMAWALAPIVSALALLAVNASAMAAGPGGDLLQNPGAEASPGATESGGVMAPLGWTVSGEFTAVQYGASGFPTTANAASIAGGVNFFAGGNSPVSTATQTVDVSASASAIDAGTESASLSGDLGGYSSQSDNMVVTATYLSASGGSLGSLSIGPVTEAERKGETTLLPRSTTGTVPVGTRSIQVVMTSTRVEGAYDDGYGDNISLSLASPQVFGATGLVQAPSSKACVSRRAFTIHIRPLAGLTYRQVAVYVNGHRVGVTRGSRISAPVDLRGLPKGRYTVKIIVTTTAGQQFTGTRSYHTCAPKRR
jgi:hypothetical protein